MILASLMLLVILIAFIFAMMKASSSRKAGDGSLAPTCGKCGYIVRGISSLSCPECGSDLREVGIMTPEMRRRAGPWAALLLWIIFVAVAGALTMALIMPVIPRLHSRTDTLRYEAAIRLILEPGSDRIPRFRSAPVQNLRIEIEVRSWEYRWSWSKTNMNPPIREIILVAECTQPVRLMIDVDRRVCAKEPGPGQALPRPEEGLPLDEETLSQWLQDAGFTPSKDSMDGASILNTLNRAILTNDADVTFSAMNRTRSGSRGGSGQTLGGVSEGLVLLWILIALAGCVVIVRRQRRHAAEAMPKAP